MAAATLADFLAATGSPGPLVLGVAEADVTQVSWRLFDQPFAVLGRGAAADLRLNHPTLGRRHAYMQLIAGRLFCVDLASRTGTRWGQEAGVWGWVRPDLGVGMGPYLVRPRGPDAPSPAPDPGRPVPAPVSRAFNQPGLPELALEIAGPSAAVTHWQASRSLVLIGRSAVCKIQLAGPGVAQIHASLVRTPHGTFIVDLLGPGGMIVNGTPRRWASLGTGDEVVIGPHRIRIAGGQHWSNAADRTHLPLLSHARIAVPQRMPEVMPALQTPLAGNAEHPATTYAAAVRACLTAQQDQLDRLTAELAEVRRQIEGRASAQPTAWPSPLPTGAPSGRFAAAIDAAPRPAPSAAADRAFHAHLFDRLDGIDAERPGPWRWLKAMMFGVARKSPTSKTADTIDPKTTRSISP